MSPNAAAIEAGFRKRVIQVPDNMEGAASALIRKWGAEKVVQLAEHITASTPIRSAEESEPARKPSDNVVHLSVVAEDDEEEEAAAREACDRQVRALMNAWNEATPEARENFADLVGLVQRSTRRIKS